MKQIQAVTSAGEIEIEPGTLMVQPVVGEIIDSAKAKRWTKMISFPGMIVNHVENHFDTSSVQAAHHCFELGDLLAYLAAAGIFSMRGEEADRVVAPVVCYAVIDQKLVIGMRMHRE